MRKIVNYKCELELYVHGMSQSWWLFQAASLFFGFWVSTFQHVFKTWVNLQWPPSDSRKPLLWWMSSESIPDWKRRPSVCAWNMQNSWVRKLCARVQQSQPHDGAMNSLERLRLSISVSDVRVFLLFYNHNTGLGWHSGMGSGGCRPSQLLLDLHNWFRNLHL